MSKTMYLLSGVPGSGKTTLADALFKADQVDITLAADMYHIDDQGNYKFDETKIMEAHEWCLEECERHMKYGARIAVHNTFTKNVYLPRYYDLAKLYGYDIIEVVMKSPFDSIHPVPPALVNMMKLQLQERLADDWLLK